MNYPVSSLLGLPDHEEKFIMSLHEVVTTYLTLLPKKMEPIEGSETSAYINQTPGNYPKGNLLN
jgi:hypothetical protein